MRPVDFKDEFYDRDPLSSNNDLYDVVVPKGTLCLDCEKRPAVSGYDLHFCEECWNNAVD